MTRIIIVQAGLGAGGTEKIAAMLARHLIGAGHSVQMLCITGDPAAPYYPMPDGAGLRTLEAERGRGAAARTGSRVGWLRRAIREARAELVISLLTKINVQVALACTGLGVKRIASERNNFLTQPMNPLWRRAMPLALATADAVVMQTRGAAAALPASARRRCVVIGNPGPETRPETRPPPQRLVAVGRLTRQKGFDTLLRALAQARRDAPEIALTIHGEGGDRAELEALRAELGLETAVALPGASPSPHAWIGEGGIFVLSSRYEGFPNVLAEALAHGFAVIATRCDWGPAEIVEHDRSGLLVPVGDEGALTRAILRLWNDAALRARLGHGARLRADLYSERRILAQWAEVIDSVAMAPAPGAESREPA